MRILAVICLYHPEPELLEADIASFAGGVDALLLWRNSPVDEKSIEAALPPDVRDKLRWAGDGHNAGISKALNEALVIAREEGFTHLLTMDQDSVWEGFDRFLDQVSAPEAPRGLFGPSRKGEPGATSYTAVSQLITSGMLVPVEVAGAAGGWWEELFTDGVDTAFCCAAARAGFGCWQVGNCFLHHRLGAPVVKHFFGRPYTVTGYGPERLYEIYRSMFLIIRSYPEAKDIRRSLKDVWIRRNPVRLLLGGRQRPAKFWAMLRGSVAGITHKLKP